MRGNAGMRAADYLRHAGGWAGVLVLLIPLLQLALASVAGLWRFPDVLPSAFTLRAWQAVFAPQTMVARALAETIGISLIVAALALAIGAPAGYALARRSVRARPLVLSILFVPVVLPPIALVLGVQVALIRLGLATTRFGVALAHLVPATPYMIFVMQAVFHRHDGRLEEVARSLGAGRLATLVQITLPSILPGVTTGCLFVMLTSWSQYLLTVLVGGGRIETLPLVLFAAVSAGDTAIAGAVGALYLLPALAVAIAATRLLARAEASGGSP